MPYRSIHFFLFFLALFFSGCNSSVKRNEVSIHSNVNDFPIKYAKHFSVSENRNFNVVYLFGNRNNKDTTAQFILFKDSATSADFPVSSAHYRSYIIKCPCKKIAALSTIYATMLCELGCINNLAAIDNIDYVNNQEITDKFYKGELKELARMPQVDIEQTVVLNPDIVFTFGMGDGEKDIDKKLEETKIPVAISVDHLEESPLARAEWIKFFGAFVDKKERADSIFAKVEKNYFKLRSIAWKVKTKPTVFTEIKYGDSWYMPGGKSFMAQLLNDAGAEYLWKDDTKAGSLPLSFEQVYAKAKDADYWINLSTLKTKHELLSFEARYAEFNAFKKGNLFNNTKVTNGKGYSSYWETGMIYPDRILSDLMLIFHPELKTDLNAHFYYYERLK